MLVVVATVFCIVWSSVDINALYTITSIDTNVVSIWIARCALRCLIAKGRSASCSLLITFMSMAETGTCSMASATRPRRSTWPATLPSATNSKPSDMTAENVFPPGSVHTIGRIRFTTAMMSAIDDMGERTTPVSVFARTSATASCFFSSVAVFFAIDNPRAICTLLRFSAPYKPLSRPRFAIRRRSAVPSSSCAYSARLRSSISIQRR